ncbi:MAG: FUSC family protein [Terrimicrobiaceae bacterium]|nr:FUSC family protein [Terrimicrobiaceae bacterium]
MDWKKLASDPAIRYGLKFGLAGVLAVYIALVLRLQEPVWALFTVFVLMIAQYVGAIGEKSVFRLIGTVAGGVIGYLLTGSLQQNPVIFLLLVGLVVGVSTAMFGQSRYPYAFLLCGLTVVVVAGNGLSDPETSWKYMLWRVEEVTLGILVTMVVQSVLWPRYARVEFLQNLREGFLDLRECLEGAAAGLLDGSPAEAAERAAGFPARITALRGLLDFGARESQHFRDRLSTFFELTTCEARMAFAISTLHEPLPANSEYRTALREQIGAWHRALAAALADLGNPAGTPATRAACRAAATQTEEAVNARLLELRHLLPHLPGTDEALVLSVHLLAFQEVQAQVVRAQDLLNSLPVDPLVPSTDHAPILSPWPPPFWIRTGIKAGLATTAALFLLDWLNPPGGSMLVLGAWVFTAMNATSPGGQGDRRAFHFVPLSVAALLVLSVILLAARPMLSSYAVMNTVIFVWLFVWGYLSFTVRGMTIPMQMAMLSIVGILGLNGQEPISFQAIVGFFFGITLALLLASLIQRLLWPSLPQWEIRDRLKELADLSQKFLRQGASSVPLWQRTRLALVPGEVAVRLPHLDDPTHHPGESATIAQILQHLARACGHLLVTAGNLDHLGNPQPVRDLHAALEGGLESIRHGLDGRTTDPTPIERLKSTIGELGTWADAVRHRMLDERRSPSEILSLLGMVERYRLATTDTISAANLIRSLDPQALNADASL